MEKLTTWYGRTVWIRYHKVDGFTLEWCGIYKRYVGYSIKDALFRFKMEILLQKREV